MGIVNGTTNYILTKMTQEGMEFEKKRWQRLPDWAMRKVILLRMWKGWMQEEKMAIPVSHRSLSIPG